MKKEIQYPMSNIQKPMANGEIPPPAQGRPTKAAAGVGRGCIPGAVRVAGRRRAFTLIEVLAAMAVLVILVLALTRMFVEAASITKRGTTTLLRNSVAETAMDTILQDLDCMLVNERLAAAKFADDVKYLAGDPQGAFDTFYFITTSGDQDDDMPYEYTKYEVRAILTNNVNGAAYWRYDLFKSRMIMAVGASSESGSPFYALRPGDHEWWDPFETKQDDAEVMAENVVMFDIYCQRWDNGQDFTTRGDDYFSMDKVDRGGGVSNIPPVAIDVMLVTTSPEAAVEGGMLLAAGERERGLAVMNRDASTVIGRAMPMMGPTQYRLQRRVHNPLSHYYLDRK
jgi:prepilin-type N-terminal cleavage/methylation domain-containing protein